MESQLDSEEYSDYESMGSIEDEVMDDVINDPNSSSTTASHESVSQIGVSKPKENVRTVNTSYVAPAKPATVATAELDTSSVNAKSILSLWKQREETTVYKKKKEQEHNEILKKKRDDIIIQRIEDAEVKKINRVNGDELLAERLQQEEMDLLYASKLARQLACSSGEKLNQRKRSSKKVRAPEQSA